MDKEQQRAKTRALKPILPQSHIRVNDVGPPLEPTYVPAVESIRPIITKAEQNVGASRIEMLQAIHKQVEQPAQEGA